MQSLKLLAEKEEINFFLKKIIKSEIISIDIEFMRRNTFFPEPCVIQISDGRNHACIDLITKINYKEMFENIFKSNKKIIIHSCRQDLEILHMILGYIPDNIFDTQFAASFLGYKYQIGYAELMEEIFNINIDKSEKMTNWKKRPLSIDQIKYALNDVVYLNKLYIYLNDKLIKTNKLIYYKEEFLNFINDIEWNPNTSDAWKRIKSINNLNKNNKNIVKIISIWREKRAIDLNLPRNWILSEKEIIEISKNYLLNNKISLPKNKCKTLNANKDSLEIESEINFFYKNNKNSYTPEKKIKINNDLKKVADELYNYFKLISDENKISYQILSPKKMVLNYLRKNDANSRLVTGWRKNIINIDKVNNITQDFFKTNL